MIDTGMIFSVCAGILIGMRLFVYFQQCRQEAAEEKKEEARQVIRRQVEAFKKKNNAKKAYEDYLDEKRKTEELEKLNKLASELKYSDEKEAKK